jgi:hypothetical protein
MADKKLRPNETLTPPQNCPACDRKVDAASKLTGVGAPSPGDVALCLYCGYPGIYGDDMKLRLPDADEAAEILANPEVTRARVAIFLASGGSKRGGSA